MRKAQVWSMDVIIAVALFSVIIVGMLIAISMSLRPSSSAVLISENKVVSSAVMSSSTNSSILVSERLDKDALERLSKREYNELKAELGITSDFCVYFEDSDGRRIDIGEVTAIGSPELNITYAGERWNCNGTKLTP